ncbi:hypothetical protein JR316_0002896 [Psilocybe cubensis]|uniref:Uncharacterized protein n=2 Tax=Psilocybe cubensis TaxID=181762 RepID=A0ACB8H6H1_PSICU|nr:hypothetical protein JR316_0002896 [Psilocybe cubensis]KAH9483429.1 hypothetical protein JR316_0002896 [Psilocybe cubensis]
MAEILSGQHDFTPQPKIDEGVNHDEKSDKLSQTDKELALRLSSIIEDANAHVSPLCQMIRKNIESFEAEEEDDRDEQALVKEVRPLLEETEKALNETNGAIKGSDPDGRLAKQAQHDLKTEQASPEQERLAEALKVLVEEVQGTVQWAKEKLNNFPKAKRDLGPLLDALTHPLTQIVGGVGLLLAGVLNLLGNLLKGFGLDSFLKGVVTATGLDKIYKGMGLGKWLNSGIKN